MLDFKFTTKGTIIRVLVTGSRDWTDIDLMRETFETFMLENNHPENPILIHGACPRGADQLADDLWLLAGFPVERHPADWDTLGKKAGFSRNHALVVAGADICYAFIRNKSKGATHCSALAELAGIPVKYVRVDDDEDTC